MYCLKEIKLASDATSVPSPPMLVPSNIPLASVVKLESSTAAGTLLMIWLGQHRPQHGVLLQRAFQKALDRPDLPDVARKDKEADKGGQQPVVDLLQHVPRAQQHQRHGDAQRGVAADDVQHRQQAYQKQHRKQRQPRLAVDLLPAVKFTSMTCFFSAMQQAASSTKLRATTGTVTAKKLPVGI